MTEHENGASGDCRTSGHCIHLYRVSWPWAAGVRGLNLIVSVAGAVREMLPLRIVKLTC